MGKKIKQKYRNAGIAPPEGKGIHTEKFHEMAIAIKKENPSYSMDRCYAIAMSRLGRNKSVNPSHRNPEYKSNKHYIRG